MKTKIKYDRIQEGVDFFPENKTFLYISLSIFMIILTLFILSL